MSDAKYYQPKPADFTDRIVLVTGATRGIGKAVAEALVKLGATVILHGRRADALDAQYQELKALGREPAVAELDLEKAQGDEYLQLTDEIERRYGRLDGLLHNASILGDLTPIDDYDIGLWQRVLHVNLTAPFILTRCLLPLLRVSDDASIVFTSSGVGNKGRAFWGAYCVSKFGTEGLAQIIAEENDSGGIRCNVIDPGPTRTRMRRTAYPAEDPATLRRPDEIVAPYLWLLGSASRGVTGIRLKAHD